MTGNLTSRFLVLRVAVAVLAFGLIASPALAQDYPPGSSDDCAIVSDVTVTGGQTVTTSGDADAGEFCFDEDSDLEVFFMQSETKLADVTADEDGNFSVSVKIPTTAKVGSASIEIRGELDGDATTYSKAITVVAAGAALPTTGRDIAMLAMWGVILVVVGTLIVRVARRRKVPAGV
jgi:hypothetical protein